MDQKALKTLEFDKIIKLLENKAETYGGKERVSDLTPTDDIELIKQRQSETKDALSCMLRYGNLPLGGLKDIRAAVKRAFAGGVLSTRELLDVSSTLYATKKVKKYMDNENKKDSFEIIESLISTLENATSLESEINRCIISETEISDDASTSLRSIRREMKIANERIKEHLNNIIHSSANKTMLQESVITIRNGRYCVPVKQEYKNSFNGMVHDQSSTGATLFIEPMSVVNLNNRIKELEGSEKAEIERILASLSVLVGENKDILENDYEVLTTLDFIFAKGKLALSQNACMPIFKDYVDIKKARHPLLDPKTVVPTDITLGKDFTALLITGPNTGGKTVFLKTIGLFCLMAQAGLHIPAFDNPILCVFDHVFADIGDEQSIEQNLSTFSSHVVNIVRILENITPNSLVLFDELGAGTDPREGAALAMGIITRLHEKRIKMVVTTHYSELKVFALSTEGIENGSCEFDLETLKPTYRFSIGIPGKSNAFAIAKRLGVKDDILVKAGEFISKEDARLEDVIADLEISKKSAEIEKERSEAFRQEAERLKDEIASQKEKLAIQKERIIKEAKKEAYEMLRTANEETEQIMKEIRKAQMDAQFISNAEQKRKELKGKLNEAYGESQEKRKKGVTPKYLSVGDRVFVIDFNQSGTVLTPPDKNGEVTVQTGIMKININISGLELDQQPTKKEQKKSVPSLNNKTRRAKGLSIKSEIDLRGDRAEEALEKVDKYLDDAYLSGLKQVSIIHGKGTGALRDAVHKYLSKNSHVITFRLGVFGEGDTGVTVVELK